MNQLEYKTAVLHHYDAIILMSENRSRDLKATHCNLSLMRALASKVFVVVSILGIGEAVYHAWLEKAFSTNIFDINYSSLAAFFGVPYWVFGVIWFPLVLLVGVWTTGVGRSKLKQNLLIFLTVGNVFTGYLWYLDIEVVRSYHPLYIALYSTNYLLTGLVVTQNWRSDVMHGYVYGTATGAVVGLLFGPYGVAACGIAGGMFGAVRNFILPKSKLSPVSMPHSNMYLEDEKAALEKRLKEIESRIGKKENQ